MRRDRRARARLNASLLARPRPAFAWPGRPLARLPRSAALAMLALLAVALVWSAMEGGSDPVAGNEEPTGASELALQSRIAERVAAGEAYHEAALAEHRAAGRPVAPILVVPLPLLAWADAYMGRGVMSLAVVLLLIAALLAWHRTLAKRTAPAERIAALALVALAGFAAFEPLAHLVHSLVAGLLLSLALALYRPGFPIPALLATATALAVHAPALPLALAWLALALFERRRRETLLLSLLILAHAMIVWLHVFTLGELMAPGESLSFEGGALEKAGLLIDPLARSFPLSVVPSGLVGPLALMALLGWLGFGNRLGIWTSLSLVAFVLAAAVPTGLDSEATALLVLPFGLAGLAFVPRALADLVRAASFRLPAE